MNGPVKMYQMRKIIDHASPVSLPNVMYKMKNIHSSRNGFVDEPVDHTSSPIKKVDILEKVKQFLKNNEEIPGMADLVARQEKILKQLAELRTQIYSIKTDLNLSETTPSQQVNADGQVNLNSDFTPLQDIVVNASPTNPPYSLEIVQRLLANKISLAVTSYLHSTVASLPEPADELSKNLVSFKIKQNVPILNVRLIWKNIESHVELLVSHTPIFGEVNLLRYISRVVRTKLSYGSDSDSITIDSLLDSCYLLTRSKTKTERQSILQTLSKSLGKAPYLASRNELGITDVAAYSAIRQCSDPNDLSASLNKWYQRCKVECKV